MYSLHTDQKNQNKSKYFPPIFVKKKKLTEGRYCTFMERLENLSFRAWIKKNIPIDSFQFPSKYHEVIILKI